MFKIVLLKLYVSLEWKCMSVWFNNKNTKINLCQCKTYKVVNLFNYQNNKNVTPIRIELNIPLGNTYNTDIHNNDVDTTGKFVW